MLTNSFRELTGLVPTFLIVGAGACVVDMVGPPWWSSGWGGVVGPQRGLEDPRRPLHSHVERTSSISTRLRDTLVHARHVSLGDLGRNPGIPYDKLPPRPIAVGVASPRARRVARVPRQSRRLGGARPASPRATSARGGEHGPALVGRHRRGRLGEGVRHDVDVRRATARVLEGTL